MREVEDKSLLNGESLFRDFQQRFQQRPGYWGSKTVLIKGGFAVSSKTYLLLFTIHAVLVMDTSIHLVVLLERYSIAISLFCRKKIQTTSSYIYDTLFQKGVNSDVTITALGIQYMVPSHS